jgi:dihydroflavonol-4-reductase
MDWTGPLAGVAPLAGSVTEPEPWAGDPALRDLRGIFHLAAVVRHSRREPGDMYRTNVEGTLAVVRVAAAHRCRMVMVSSTGTVACFGSPAESADEDAPWCEARVARWPYYHSKILAERRARALADQLGVELVIARPPVLLGPGDHRFRSTAHLLRYLRGRVPFVIRGGMHFADVRDVAAALVRIMERPAARPVYHLPGVVCGVADFFALAGAVAGLPAPRLVLPYPLAWALAAAAAAIGRVAGGRLPSLVPDPVVIEMARHHWGAASRYAAEELGYRTRDGRETLTDTVAWLRAHHPALRDQRDGGAARRAAT